MSRKGFRISSLGLYNDDLNRFHFRDLQKSDFFRLLYRYILFLEFQFDQMSNFLLSALQIDRQMNSQSQKRYQNSLDRFAQFQSIPGLDQKQSFQEITTVRLTHNTVKRCPGLSNGPVNKMGKLIIKPVNIELTLRMVVTKCAYLMHII